MTTLREAAQHALEALELRCGTNAEERGPDGAITALRAALAEPQEMRVPMIGACQACGHEHEFPQREPHEPSRELLEALQIIATPQRPDGTWNRDREACRQLAAEVLGFHNKGGQDE